KGDAEVGEGLLVQLMVSVNHLLRGDSLLAGLEGDWNAVFVGTADGDDVLAAHPAVSCLDVRRHVNPCQASYVNRSVGLRKSRCDEIAFELLQLLKVIADL